MCNLKKDNAYDLNGRSFLYKKIVRCSRTGRFFYIKKSSGAGTPDDFFI